jgi:hypothetical protein
MVPQGGRDPDQDLLDRLDAKDGWRLGTAFAFKIAVGAMMGGGVFLALRFGAKISTELSVDASVLAAILVVLVLGIHRGKIGFQ